MPLRPLVGCLLAITSVFVLLAGQARAEERRVALVIGNSAYQNVPYLPNPANDARLIAATLTRLGFVLVGGGPVIDADKPAFDAAIEKFGSEIANADVALFYYSGHGMQVGNGNWLLPVGANPTRVQDLDFQMVSLDLVLRQMDGAGTRLNVVVLDACRNNPFAGSGLRGGARGLAQIQAPSGTLISYATQPGNVAQDGAGANSLFTASLAEAMQIPGIDIFRMFNRVGITVKRQTGGEQQPWVSNSPIEGDFYFAGRFGAEPPAQASQPQAEPVVVPHAAPEPPRNPIEEGQTALARGDYAAAETAARHALAEDGRPAESYFLLAEALMPQRKYQAAAVAYHDAYESERAGPRAASALLGMANAFFALGNRRPGCTVLKLLRAEFPRQSRSWDHAAGLGSRQGCAGRSP